MLRLLSELDAYVLRIVLICGLLAMAAGAPPLALFCWALAIVLGFCRLEGVDQ